MKLRWLPLCLLLSVACRGAVPCAVLYDRGAREDGGRCIVDGDLVISGPLDGLPERLTVRGRLEVHGRAVPALPRGLVVEGDLYLSKTGLSELPRDLVVRGGFDWQLGMLDSSFSCADLPPGVAAGKFRRCE